jgi:hypothetical protein
VHAAHRPPPAGRGRGCPGSAPTAAACAHGPAPAPACAGWRPGRPGRPGSAVRAGRTGAAARGGHPCGRERARVVCSAQLGAVCHGHVMRPAYGRACRCHPRVPPCPAPVSCATSVSRPGRGWPCWPGCGECLALWRARWTERRLRWS